jgi:polysaccharide biosynthesis protein
MKSNLLKKFLSFSVGGYINILIGLIAIPIITRIISPEEYGIFSLVDVLIQIFVILSLLGMEQGFVRFFYDEEKTARGKLLFNSISIPLMIVFLLSIILYIFRRKIAIFIIGKDDYFLWKLLSLGTFFTVLRTFSFLVIRMQQRGKLYSFLNVFFKLVEFLFVFIFFYFLGNSYKTLAYSYMVSLMLTVIISIIKEKNIWNFSGKSIIEKKELINYSLPLSLTMALTWIFASSDKIMIKLFSNLKELGYYAGAFKIILVLNVIQSGFTTFWTPVMYEHYQRKPEDKYFFKRINDYLSLIFFLLGTAVLMLRNFSIIVLGKNYYESIYIIPMLVFIPVMYLISETTMMGIVFKKKSKYLLYISIIVAIINIIGNLTLIPYIGAKGAAISTGTSYIVFFYFRTYFSQKLIDFKFNLKRIYFIVALMFLYALYLTFYNKLYITILIGIFLEIIIIFKYRQTLKKIYIILLKMNKK